MQVFYSDVRDYFCEWDYLQEIINYLTPKLDDEYILHVACLSEECNNYKDGVKFVEGKKNIIKWSGILNGRTDFKGQSMLKYRVASEDPMCHPKGNFYHYHWQ